MTPAQHAHLRIRYRPVRNEALCDPGPDGCDRCIVWQLLEDVASRDVAIDSLRAELRRSRR